MAEVTRERLKSVPFMGELPDEHTETLIAETRVVKVPAGKALSDGDRAATSFYYVESGDLKVEARDPTGNKVSYRHIGQGEYLSLYPLITGRPAEVEAQATQDSTLLAFPADMLHRILLSGVRQEAYSRGNELFKQDQPAEFLYFILEGSFQLVREVEVAGQTQTVRRRAGPGEYLGRYALITSETYRATATAEQDATVLAIPFRALQSLLFIHPGWREWFYPLEVAERLRAIPLFKWLEDWDIYLLSDEARLEEFKPDETIYSADEPAEHFYVIDRGQVEEQPVSGEASWYLAAGNFFGDDSLTGGWQRKATVVARKPTRVFRLPGRVVAELIQQRNVKFNAQATREALVNRLGAVALFRTRSARAHLRRLAGYVNLVYFRPGDTVARQGDVGDRLMILHEGEAVVLRQSGRERPRPVRRMSARLGDPPGSRESESFGERALTGRETLGATVEVTRPSTWIVLKRSDFEQFRDDTGLTEDDFAQAAESDEEEEAAAAPLQAETLPLPWRRRRHWIVMAGNVLPGLLLALLMVVWLLLSLDDVSGGADIVFFIGRGFLLLFFLGWAVWGYLEWRNDVFIITSEAVLHIERELLTSEDRYEAPLHQIQNVNLQSNVIGQILKFGDVIIETAAARGQVAFTRIPHPEEAQDLIRRASDEAKAGRQVKEMESIRQRLEDRLSPERLNPAAPGSVLEEQPTVPTTPASPDAYRPPPFFIPPFEEHRDGKIIWRKHWFNLFQRTGLPVVATGVTGIALLVIAVPVLARALGANLPDVIDRVAQVWMVPVLLAAFALSTLWLKYKYEDWKNDVYILTADQVIDQERELAVFPLWWLYSELKRAAALTNVQYVDLRIPNLLAIIFNYGDVIVRTAGATGQLDFSFVRNPRRVHATILRRLAEFQERERERQFEERWQDMARWLEAYHDVTRRGRVSGN